MSHRPAFFPRGVLPRPRQGLLGPVPRAYPPMMGPRSHVPRFPPPEPPDKERGGGDRGDKAICRHFARGYCRYGPECGFLHPGQNGPLKPLPPVYLTYESLGEDPMDDMPFDALGDMGRGFLDTGDKSERPVCRHYANGYCRLGNTCGFRHPITDIPADRPVCRHFKKGYCRLSDECSFLHPGVNGPLREES